MRLEIIFIVSYIYKFSQLINIRNYKMFDLQSLVKYLLEGLAVAIAAYLIPRKRVDPTEIAMIALTAAAVFAVLDTFAPLVAVSARHGAGFGIGYQQVGYGRPRFEGFNGQSLNNNNTEFEGYDDYEQGEGFQDTNTTTTAMNGSANLPGTANTMTSSDMSDMGTNATSSTTPLTSSPSTSASQTPSTGDDDIVDSQNVCQLNGETCTYNPLAKPEQKAHYLCRKDGTSLCQPVRACKKIGQGTDIQCQLEDSIQTLPDVAGRVCQPQDANGTKQCRLTQRVEGFTSSEVTGFEGFSKVF